jgi:Leu/Phe-tRNA-protein transferase
MKKLLSLLFLSLIVGLGNLSAQTPMQSDSMKAGKNKMQKENGMNPMDNMQQDSMMWYRTTDSMMTPMNKMQRDSMMKTMNKTQREGMKNYRNRMQKDSMRLNRTNMHTDSLMKPKD